MGEAKSSGKIRVVRTMPEQKPGRSRQDYGTPLGLMMAVRKRFGPIVHDLAATKSDSQATTFYSPEQDSLVQRWGDDHPLGTLWLNPPFDHIAPWATKCREESAGRLGLILLLVPASIGSNWFVEHVHMHALVLALTPRLVFKGQTQAYPKDCILAVYGQGASGFNVWRWKP